MTSENCVFNNNDAACLVKILVKYCKKRDLSLEKAKEETKVAYREIERLNKVITQSETTNEKKISAQNKKLREQVDYTKRITKERDDLEKILEELNDILVDPSKTDESKFLDVSMLMAQKFRYGDSN